MSVRSSSSVVHVYCYYGTVIHYAIVNVQSHTFVVVICSSTVDTECRCFGAFSLLVLHPACGLFNDVLGMP